MLSFSTLRGSLLATAALLPGAAYAQQRPATPPAAAATPAETDEIVVTGARLQAVREIEAKREIAVISDSISADEIGTLPDFGLGEALARVPGVSTVQNNARGEAQFLSIRGLNADYNLVQIDGVTLPANEIGRRTVSLDVIPSSLAQRVEVYKTTNAAMNPNAIGGTANLRTRSAFDRRGRTFIGGRFDIGRWDEGRVRSDGGPSGQAELVGSTTFGSNRQFGVVVAGSYFRRDSASLNSAVDNYLYFDPASGARLDELEDDVSRANVAPARRRWLQYDNVRERYGVFGKLEFDDHRMFNAALTLADFRHINDEDRQSNLMIGRGNPVAASITPTRGTLVEANAQVDLAQFHQTRRMRYADFHAELTPNDRVRADLGVNYAVATYVQTGRFATYRAPNSTRLGYTYDIVPGAFPYLDFTDPAYVADPANYRQFEYGTNRDDNREEALTARAKIGINMDRADEGFGVGAGAYARYLDRRYDFGVDNYRPLAASNYRLSSVLLPERYAPYNGRGQTLLFVDPGAAQTFFETNRAGFAANPDNANGNVQADFDLTEDIHAGYLMARYATPAVRLTAGIRYEDTRLSTGSNDVVTTGNRTAIAYGRRATQYHDWLPSAQADWDVTDRLRLRAAFSRTLGRPNYDDLAARERVNVNSRNDDTTVSITSGNPDLRPRRSSNFDLSAEYYVSRDVLFSVAGFVKKVSDEILTVRNQATETFDGEQQLVTRIRPVNGSEATVRGVELNAVVARMRFLPAPLDGLGFSANLTLLDPTPPEITLADQVTTRRLSSLFESSSTVANVKLFYTAGPVTVQGAWNHLSPKLFAVSTSDPLQDRRYAASDLFDAQLRLTLNRHLTVVAQGKNLSNFRPQRMFGPGFGLLREEIDNGRAFYIGALVRY